MGPCDFASTFDNRSVSLTPQTLAERVKQAIHAAGLTQQSVAEAIGIDPSALSRALSGQRDFKSVEIALLVELSVFAPDARRSCRPVMRSTTYKPAEAVARRAYVNGQQAYDRSLGW